MRPLCFADTHEIREEGSGVQVLVRDNNVDQALRALKKKLQREGVFREMKLRGHYEKPSERRSAKGSCRQSRVRSQRPEAPGPGRRWHVERGSPPADLVFSAS